MGSRRPRSPRGCAAAGAAAGATRSGAVFAPCACRPEGRFVSTVSKVRKHRATGPARSQRDRGDGEIPRRWPPGIPTARRRRARPSRRGGPKPVAFDAFMAILRAAPNNGQKKTFFAIGIPCTLSPSQVREAAWSQLNQESLDSVTCRAYCVDFVKLIPTTNRRVRRKCLARESPGFVTHLAPGGLA